MSALHPTPLRRLSPIAVALCLGVLETPVFGASHQAPPTLMATGSLGAVAGPCPNPGHDCLTEGGPGCSDPACCLAICGLDPFCCLEAWDVLCVAEAQRDCYPPLLCPTLCPADLDRSCAVDGADLGLLLGAWGSGPSCADLTGDLAVGGADLGILLGAWGPCTVTCADIVTLLDMGTCALEVPIQQVYGMVYQPLRSRIAAAISAGLGGQLSQHHVDEVLWAIDCGFANACSSPVMLIRAKVKIDFARALLARVDQKLFVLKLPPLLFGDYEATKAALIQQLYDIWSNLLAARDQLESGPPPKPCPETDHDCCTIGDPGCTDYACCTAVCLIDPTCCTAAWDADCVAIAEILCGLDCGDCPQSDHDCYTTGGPGCTDPACCAIVCAVDPFCCNVAWDGICVNEAFQFCGAPTCDFSCPPGSVPEPELCGQDTDGGCNVPVVGNSNCCVAWGGLGCDDPACQAAVCPLDPFCCDVAWDGICAAEALELCPGVCQPGTPSFAPIACGQTVCGSAWADGNFRDTDWYEIALNALPGTEITFSLQTTLPMVIGIVDTNGVPDCSLASSLNPFAVAGFCGTASFTACLGPGVYWFFAAPNAFSGFPCGTRNAYAITLACLGACNPPACGNAGHDCLTTGGPFCDDAACCFTICAVDAFCCDVAWDQACVNQAALLCYGQCPDGGHDCFTTGDPGCSDPGCCAAVCAVDPFCCIVAWDGICVNEAFQFCGAPPCEFSCASGATAEGEPCGFDANGGCNSIPPIFGSISCGQTICGSAWADGGFRDTDWYVLLGGQPGIGTLSISTTLPMVIGLLNSVSCATADALSPFAVAAFCGAASFQFEYNGVEAWLFAGPNGFSGFPCGTINDYEISLVCAPDLISSCCLGWCVQMGCDVQGCQNCVCNQDLFCCTTCWDGICAAAALPGGVCAGGCPCS